MEADPPIGNKWKRSYHYEAFGLRQQEHPEGCHP